MQTKTAFFNAHCTRLHPVTADAVAPGMPRGPQTAAPQSPAPIAPDAMASAGEGCSSERRPTVGVVPGGTRRSSELTPEKSSVVVKKPRTAAGSDLSGETSTGEGSCDLTTDHDGTKLVPRSEITMRAPHARVTRAESKRSEVQLYPMLSPPAEEPGRARGMADGAAASAEGDRKGGG